MSESSSSRFLIFILLLVVIVGFFVVSIYNRGTNELTIATEKGEPIIKIKLDGNTASINKILEKLFESEESSKMARLLLKEFHGLYDINDLDSKKLISRIKKEKPNTDFSRNLRMMISDVKGPFETTKYYDVDKKTVLDGLKSNGINHEVTKALREMASNNEAPLFKVEKIRVRLSNKAVTSEGEATVCKGRGYDGRYLYLTNPKNNNMVQVKASLVFPVPCGEFEDKIRISIRDSEKLFGHKIKDSKMLYMVAAQEGMQFVVASK